MHGSPELIEIEGFPSASATSKQFAVIADGTAKVIAMIDIADEVLVKPHARTRLQGDNGLPIFRYCAIY
ncbi:hypothetical protein [Rhizobium mongolense]|uniref:Uncharacterized protein n=1 Tax=Rhizobium mongolense TaxID=57676 RepID=A0ABR6IFL9_9HYPH|nr:hypothetical protein [Rhizobium mongolense]MBB4226663.1 hypothetical protein [Rhizobium mongolense]